MRSNTVQPPKSNPGRQAFIGLAIAAFAGSIAFTCSMVSNSSPVLERQPMQLPGTLSRDLARSMPDQVRLEDLTFTEVIFLMQSGFDRVIVPTGGTEQNGLHMVLGKHNYVVRHTADKIAREVGQTLVAPVMPYVPEGGISPPSGHMKFAGTLSLPRSVFGDVLEYTARSLKAHGFKHIFFVGDSGGNQKSQARIAKKLSGLWRDEGVAVYALSDYYAGNHQVDKLKALGESQSSIGTHAGIRDTSELLAVHKAGVRQEILKNRKEYPLEFSLSGYTGAPDRATTAYGEAMIALKIKAGVTQMKRLLDEALQTAQSH